MKFQLNYLNIKYNGGQNNIKNGIYYTSHFLKIIYIQLFYYYNKTKNNDGYQKSDLNKLNIKLIRL